jgi:hypothetical protein
MFVLGQTTVQTMITAAKLWTISASWEMSPSVSFDSMP